MKGDESSATKGDESSATIDVTGRIALPRKLRRLADTGKIVLCRGADSNLWLYTPEQWERFEKMILSTTNQFSAEGRILRQHFIGSRNEIESDKQGRILIPPTLRHYAGLSKDCIVFGQGDYVEIWDKERYNAYSDASKEVFKAGLEKLGAELDKERDLGNGGSSSHSGSAGTNAGVSRAEGQE